ncbi:MAG: hypothetical protein WC549_06020 [Actinomycetota bacterium]
MKKNKLYIILAILSTIFLLSFAAICNQCGTAAEEEENVEEEEVAEEEATEEESAGEEEEEAAEEEEEEEEAEEEEEEEAGEKEEPTISISIYEGPTYNPADGVCYYRMQANVTGNPGPDVEWSKDDSDGAWGTRKAQVNLDDPGDTYTLTATATNSEGTDTDSIELIWGCEEEVAEEPEIVEEDAHITADVALSGWIRVDISAYQGEELVYVGDSSENKYCKTYLSFDISALGALSNATITEAAIAMPLDSVEPVHNHPELAGSEVNVKVFYYGDALDLGDGAVGGETVKTIGATSTLTSFNFSSTKLKEELQKAIDINRQWFQLKLGLSGISADGIGDYYKLHTSAAVLHITYEYEGT